MTRSFTGLTQAPGAYEEVARKGPKKRDRDQLIKDFDRISNLNLLLKAVWSH